MDELLRRLDGVLTQTPLADLRIELQTLLTAAYRRGAMDFKQAVDTVMEPCEAAVESYRAYVAQWQASEAQQARPAKGRGGPEGSPR